MQESFFVLVAFETSKLGTNKDLKGFALIDFGIDIFLG